MFGDVFDKLFGCWHKHYSFPITAKKGSAQCQAARVTGTYVVCLDCGKEFPYDWNRMRVVSAGSGFADIPEGTPIPPRPSRGYVKAA